ncbi:VUT family protein [Echinicola strongylocentroti]|uniref:Probable queuosine precursor transporter n=1 Tax=Echinicola strongylocentroti TaxID=1795355 RepID=A0A2Z4IDU5_9BACT|nr:queuosine precursor transporter [Echinicola strongylocentroti]AWW28985.1 VUT family protein [Echinicola strongylocentroti]
MSNTADQNFQNKKTTLFIVLSGIFLTNAILAELIGVKIFSGEATLGLEPANWTFFGDYVLDFNLTAGAVIWPVVFITTDIINEYFGKKGVRKISFLTAGFIAYAFIFIVIVTALPPAAFWLDVNSTDPNGNPFNIEYAFDVIFRQGLGIIIGSLTAFLLGQLIDVFIFQKLRKITGAKMIWLRATGSTLVSQLIDSFVVLGIAFYVFGNWSIEQLISVGIINYIYKFTVAIILTPLLYLGHNIIDNYLGKEYAERMAEEAAGNTSF